MYSIEGRVGFFDTNFHSVNILEIDKVNSKATNEDYERFYENAKSLHEKQNRLNFIYHSGWSSNILK